MARPCFGRSGIVQANRLCQLPSAREGPGDHLQFAGDRRRRQPSPPLSGLRGWAQARNCTPVAIANRATAPGALVDATARFMVTTPRHGANTAKKSRENGWR
jgi:hypothetical protein